MQETHLQYFHEQLSIPFAVYQDKTKWCEIDISNRKFTVKKSLCVPVSDVADKQWESMSVPLLTTTEFASIGATFASKVIHNMSKKEVEALDFSVILADLRASSFIPLSLSLLKYSNRSGHDLGLNASQFNPKVLVENIVPTGAKWESKIPISQPVLTTLFCSKSIDKSVTFESVNANENFKRIYRPDYFLNGFTELDEYAYAENMSQNAIKIADEELKSNDRLAAGFSISKKFMKDRAPEVAKYLIPILWKEEYGKLNSYDITLSKLSPTVLPKNMYNPDSKIVLEMELTCFLPPILGLE